MLGVGKLEEKAKVKINHEHTFIAPPHFVIQDSFTMSSNQAIGSPPSKKRKLEEVLTLPELCSNRDWDDAIARAISHPEEALLKKGNSTPLAFACRLGAPAECVKALLDASPEPVRQLLSSRGTPLHEAILCESKDGSVVVELLLQADEKLPGTRACLLQDVDGHTPLHLLIRRRFQWHLRREDGDNAWLHMLQLLVKSSPEAVGIPDRGEYEEPPLVMALKASLYAGGDLDEIMFRCVERRIRETIACMLEHYPQAASQILSGARGHYTALHSAVFHGRCSDTIHLLLKAEQQQGCATSRAALLANTQGELPLHFAAMRGEPPRSIALLAIAAPMAVLTRDSSGLTPFHWLWIRFVSALLALENERGETTVEARRITSTPVNKYLDFASLERGDFYADLDMIRKLDPPVDFLRMRHIPQELLGEGSEAAEWADRSVDVLSSSRQRYVVEQEQRNIVWTRREVVISLFWTKVVSLLKAPASTMDASSHFQLVHAALACPSCPPPVAQLICSLYPDELSVLDPSTGRLPLHYAACRSWHSWDWPRASAEAEQSVPAATQLLRGESIAVLQNAIGVSPPQAARVADHEGQLALHHAIDSFVRACSNSGRSYMVDTHKPPLNKMLQVLQELVKSYPDSLERRDGKTKLYPFLQATAAATENRSPPSPNGFAVPFPDEMPLSMVYLLLRENPSLVRGQRVLEHTLH